MRDAAEARLCAAIGADIVDCKDPAAGALGAVGPGAIAEIRAAVPASIPVSATIGDVGEPSVALERAVAAVHAGADLVKIGFFPGFDHAALLARLAAHRPLHRRLVGVLFADRAPEFTLIASMQQAGFVGVMLDTVQKAEGALPDMMTAAELGDFVRAAHGAALLAGFAGGLRLHHIARLLPLEPDVLGFRGALCRHETRADSIDRVSALALRAAIPRMSARQPGTMLAVEVGEGP